jgi:hypothetical protein
MENGYEKLSAATKEETEEENIYIGNHLPAISSSNEYQPPR